MQWLPLSFNAILLMRGTELQLRWEDGTCFFPSQILVGSDWSNRFHTSDIPRRCSGGAVSSAGAATHLPLPLGMAPMASARGVWCIAAPAVFIVHSCS